MFDRSNNTGVIGVKIDGSVLLQISSFKMHELSVSSKLNWWPYIISIFKIGFNKIGALIRSKKFLSPEVALYLCESTISPCTEYRCLFWAGAPSSYLEILDKLQRMMCTTADPSFFASLKPFVHRRNVASLILFCRYYFGRCSAKLQEVYSLFC